MKEILERCAERQLLLHPETVSLLKEREVADEDIEGVLSLPEGTVVTPDHISGNGGTGTSSSSPPSPAAETAGGGAEGGAPQSGPEPEPTERRSGDFEPGLTLLEDSTGESEGEGELDDFRTLFRDRLDRLRKVLEKRQGLHPRRIDSVQPKMEREVTVVGMVSSRSRTGNGNLLVRLEDEGGEIPAIVLSRDEDLMERAETLLPDEVVGLVGRTRRDSDLLLVEDLRRPDVPVLEPGRGRDVYAAFISDIHVGSDTFLRDELENFFSWLDGDVGNEQSQRTAARTEYLVIAGDLVDGIGVYPGQEQELTVEGLLEQYEEAAALLDELPRDLEVVIAPGNHDAVRQAEPQPALRDEYAEALDVKNVTLVSNPATVGLDGVKVLIYHGRALDDMVASIPHVDYPEPTEPMKELLKRRHLGPVYGSKTPLSPEKRDFLVIDEVPDVLHCGHVHTFGMDSYRGVTLINGGTWQSQTPFQKRMNIEPDPGMVPLMNLADGSRKMLRFA